MNAKKTPVRPTTTNNLEPSRRALEESLDKARSSLMGRSDDLNLAKTTAGRLRSVLQMIEGYAPQLSVQQFTSFLTVAMYPGRSLRSLAEMASVPQSTMSRHMLDLGLYRRTRKSGPDGKPGRAPGIGLIDATTPPDNLRERHYTLTPKGRAVLNVIETVLGDTRSKSVDTTRA